MAHCNVIERRLNALIELRREVVAELHQPDLPAWRRSELISELKLLGQAIAAAKRALQQCRGDDIPRPDLVADEFLVNARGQSMSVAGRIVNRGDAAASGPFTVTLGVTFTAPNGQSQTRQRDVLIPPETTIEGFGTAFVTQPVTDIPVTGGLYVLEMIVDAERQVNESAESNNYLRREYRVLMSARRAG